MRPPNQVASHEAAAELLGECGSVVSGGLKDDLGASVGQDGSADAAIQLAQVLVSQRQADTEAASLGQKLPQVGGQVDGVLELVDHHESRQADSSALDGLPQPGDHQGAHQGGCFRTQLSPGQGHQQDLPPVEHLRHAPSRLRLADTGS